MPALPAAHLVHFYSTPEGLAASLCGFFAEPLTRGDSVVVVARPQHRSALDAALRRAGVDLAAEIRSGRYLALDVDDTLALVMKEGRPSRELFDSKARSVVVEAKRRTGAVHVYGEMIGTLVSRGDIAAALELEGMWAEFLRESPFPLVCGFPREALEGDLAAVLEGVTSIHDAFVATRNRTEAGFDLEPDSAAAAAREHTRRTLLGWGRPDDDSLAEALVVVSELVTAAAREGASHVTLGLAGESGEVVVSVTTPGGARPGAAPAEEDLVASGLSMAVLRALTAGWGLDDTPEGVRTWARLRR